MENIERLINQLDKNSIEDRLKSTKNINNLLIKEKTKLNNILENLNNDDNLNIKIPKNNKFKKMNLDELNNEFKNDHTLNDMMIIFRLFNDKLNKNIEDIIKVNMETDNLSEDYDSNDSMDYSE